MNNSNDTPLISIILPTYNSILYLRRCVDSIIAQDYSNFEIILVDDGSTDSTSFICDEYNERYENVFVFHKKNEGASLARKYGLERANGKYVCFVDSDDWVSPNYISKLYKLVEEFKVNVSACSIHRIKGGYSIESNIRDIYPSSLLTFKDLMPRFFKYEFWGFWGKMYLKSCLENLSFPSATLSEDYYVMAQLFNKERQIAYTEEPLYYYEYHENSLSHQKLSKKAFEEFENVKAVYEYTILDMPEYTDYALSNVVETCVKLFSIAKDKEKRMDYKAHLSSISTFLKKHFKDIVCCKPLNGNVKLLALLLALSPKSFFLVINRL